ncbi:endonuclease/exonuclease/phosphatase family protein [Subsaxibacter sp. CAU 1640]|uniref:endonuclease/exonuclease/phosphatase family protein n=1 Tax=Subsaxibacter sp. CAU 1640 TaxID=2933271 RepID=UPI0020047A30|nr:endonuclease/exonuclease/phosphatase family protein [Subsaxibacter sp. CAU 1640]MCK7591776.1 endonuclease/exonuclease/phosphatase family protein [Subsaxibacter sp. CAU 1640]
MKNLKLFDKLVFFVNSIAAVLLFLSYILPYFEPKKFAFLSVLSLTVPFLILLNILFVVYWLLKVKKQLLLSLIVILIGYKYITSLYKFSSSKNVDDSENISIMNYNVRLFNVFKWIPNEGIDKQIVEFINDKQPDILSIQEYRRDDDISFSGYHKFEEIAGDKVKNGQAILSKFPIVNSGSIEFPESYNNAIFIDVVKGKDTIRVYNVHLQSMKIDANADALVKETSENLFKSVSKTFTMQQFQTELFLMHKKQCKYKMIICGDFNNTAYSYVYKEIKGDLQDAFVEAGNGFGRTFDFKFFPVRIDFILVDEAFEINSFKTFDVSLSDHYPIMSRIKLK